MPKEKSIDQLFILRFLGAIVVVVHHYGLSAIQSTGFWHGFFNNAGFVLSFFFVLSGYVLGYNYFGSKQYSTSNFAIRRFARFFPIYILAFLATLFTAMFHHQAYPKGVSIIAQGLALHAWIPGSVIEINFPSWSVSVEILFYVLFPFLTLYLGRLKFNSLLLVSIFIWILSTVQHILFETYLYDPTQRWTGEFILYFPLWHINAFIMGLGGAEIFKRIRGLDVPRWIPLLLSMTALTTIVIITGTDNFIRPHIHNGLMAPVIVLMLLCFSLDRSIIGRSMATRPMIFLGNLTYAIYIFQYPVHMWTKAAFFPNGIQGNDFYIYLLILIVISIMIYKFIEVPARKWLIKRAVD